MRTIIFTLLVGAGLLLAFTGKESFIISGRIVFQSGNSLLPLSSANVAIKGSQKSVLTNSQGQFSIEVPGLNVSLEISSVGYETKEIKITSKNDLLIILNPLQNELSEVVVTGYGSRAPKLEKNRAHSTIRVRGMATLSGKAAGVQLNSNPGYAGQYDPMPHEREGYDFINENRFLKVTDNPLSTFSIDVDAASYSNVRRFIQNGQLPPAGAVRIEEMINYFTYDYAQPNNGDPFAVHTELGPAPWNKEHRLVMIGLQGRKVPTENLPPSNLVFLIDVSGSMQDPNKLPLVKASMKMLADQLRETDRVAIVVYAGAAGLVLPPTPGSEKIKIKSAIDKLEAGGSTAGGAGIKLAYSTARKYFMESGNNRVILCTDGDFNVGASSDDAMERLIEEERKSGVFLTVLGYGMGNYQDAKMQKLADKGNGNHAYIDQLSEARKVLVNEFGGTLFTIAKDVKLQIEFNPAKVQAYRLIGYENRLLQKEDFNNDKKDAGELGSGHTVTAFYEIIPVGVQSAFTDSVDALKYSKPEKAVNLTSYSTEWMTVKLRFKKPDGEKSRLMEVPVNDHPGSKNIPSENFLFASAVAGYGMLLRQSEFKGDLTFSRIEKMAKSALGNDAEGYRREFLKMVENTSLLVKSITGGDEEVVVHY